MWKESIMKRRSSWIRNQKQEGEKNKLRQIDGYGNKFENYGKVSRTDKPFIVSKKRKMVRVRLPKLGK